jgi:ankyrin repeat protein
LILQINPAAINAITTYGCSVLHSAAEAGHKEVCEFLVPKMSPESLNAVSNEWYTALHHAAQNGMKEVCEMLISKMSQDAINTTSYGATILHSAAEGGNKEVFELILQVNPEDINAVTKDGYTVLYSAAEGGNKEICKVMIGNMHVKKVITELNTSSNRSPIKGVLGKMVADFIGEKFFSNEYPTEFDDYEIKLLKLYQVVSKDLLVDYLGEAGNSNLCINRANNYIEKHYFTLIGVCKSISQDNPLSILVASDCMSHVLSHLGPHNLLLPELFPCAELIGESVESNSGSEENIILS